MDKPHALSTPKLSTFRVLSLAVLLGLGLVAITFWGFSQPSQVMADRISRIGTSSLELSPILELPPIMFTDTIRFTPSNTYYLPIVFRNYKSPVWTYLGPENVLVKTLAVDPQAPEILYVGTGSDGVYKSVDGGTTWNNMSGGLPISAPIGHIVIDPIQTESVFVSTSQYPRVFMSQDGGESWIPGGGLQFIVTALIINPVTPATLYVATAPFEMVPAGVYRSQDAGETWTEISPSPYYGYYSLLALYNTPQTIYAAETGLYKSSDDGNSWQKLTDLQLGQIVVSPHNEQTIYSTNGFVTHDGGVSWEAINTPLPGETIYRIVVDPLLPQVLYASLPCQGVYVSLDAGQQWQPVNAGLGELCAGNLVMSPDGAYLYGVSTTGIWRLELDSFHPLSNTYNLGGRIMTTKKTALLFIIGFALLPFSYSQVAPTQQPQINETLLAHDAIPVPLEIQAREAAQADAVATLGSAPGSDRTSDFMLGRVVVGIVLPESDGNTENWTTTERNTARDEVLAALNWWQDQANARGIQQLEFIVPDSHPVYVATSYEPINEIGLETPFGDAHLWINDVMANMGYGGQSHIERVRAYANDLRQTYDADWALVIFVVDASTKSCPGCPDGVVIPEEITPEAGLFAPGSWGIPDVSVTAWTSRPGPHTVINNWSAQAQRQEQENLENVIAHEMGHIFGAADEVWAGGGDCTSGSECDVQFGYESVENQNCNRPAPCALNEPTCVMRVGDLDFLCPYSAGQIGWWDTDSDGLMDPIDTTPVITITSAPSSPTTDNTPTYTGIVEDIPAQTTQQGYIDVTVNDVVVEFRVDGGSWVRGVPSDGAFDYPYEEFSFSFLSCEGGTYTVEARAVNVVGNISTTTFNHQITVQQSPDVCEHTYLPLVMKDYNAGGGMALPGSPDMPTPEPYPGPEEPPLPLPPSPPSAYPPPSYSWTFNGEIRHESTGHGLADSIVRLYRNVLGYFQPEDSVTTTANGIFSLEYTAEQSNCYEFIIEETDPADYLSTGAIPGTGFTRINNNQLLSTGCLLPGTFDGHLFYNDTHIVIGEVGFVDDSLTHVPKTVVFSHAYANPVVFAQPISRDGSDKSVVRITDVQADRFSLYVEEAPNHGSGSHTTEAVSYVVLEAGVWELPNGGRLEVGKLTTSATVGGNIGNQWAQVSFSLSFPSAPVVISQVQTEYDPHWVKTRQHNIMMSGFEVALEEEESKTTPHGSEIVGWLAIELSEGDWNGHTYKAGQTSNAVTHNWHQISFGQEFGQVPRFIAAMATYDGGDNAHLRYDRSSLSATGVQVMVEEDITWDSETNHTTEVVHYLVIQGDGT